MPYPFDDSDICDSFEYRRRKKNAPLVDHNPNWGCLSYFSLNKAPDDPELIDWQPLQKGQISHHDSYVPPIPKKYRSFLLQQNTMPIYSGEFSPFTPPDFVNPRHLPSTCLALYRIYGYSLPKYINSPMSPIFFFRDCLLDDGYDFMSREHRLYMKVYCRVFPPNNAFVAFWDTYYDLLFPSESIFPSSCLLDPDPFIFPLHPCS
jgi:hypothetical protein